MSILAISWALSLLFAIFFVLMFQVCVLDEDLIHSGHGKERLGAAAVKQKSLFMRLFGGLIIALGEIISTLPLGRTRDRLSARLIQAGSPAGLNPDQFHAARFVGIVLLGLAGAFFDNELALTPACTLLLGALGIIYPDLWLNGVIAKRKRRIFRDLPDMLDILRLAIDAGMDLSSAIKIVVDKGRQGPLLYELERVERDITLGLTRRQAFDAFAGRIGMTQVNAFVLALMQADQLGAPIGPILRVQGEMARTKRWQMAEEMVNKLPMKMLGPLVLFIFPASFIILFTPLIIQWMQAD